MRYTTTQRVLMSAVAAIFAVAVFVWVSRDTPTSTTQAPITTTPAVDEQSTPNTTESNQPTPKKEVVRSKREQALITQVHVLLQTYYTIPPDATEASMRSAVKKAVPAISPRFFEQLYFGVEETRRPQNHLRWENQLTLRPTIHADKLVLTKQAGTQAVVSVPITLHAYRPGGEEEFAVEATVISTWRYTQKTWTLLGLSDHTAESDGA